MKTLLSDIRTYVEQCKGYNAQLIKTQADIARKQQDSNKLSTHLEQAIEIVKVVGLKTQEKLQYEISEITTMALDTVFDESYVLSAEFVERRGKTECDLLLKTDEMTIDPLSASGGGVVDVLSFALRVAAYSMQHPKVRPVLLLDEPFTHLSDQLLPKACLLLKRISEELNVQLIIITHAETLMDSADVVFKVNKMKGVSKVQ